MAGRTREVVWTYGARNSLDEVLEYIAEGSSIAAARFLEVVLDTAESLSFLAERGRMVPELGRSDTREVFVYSYRMIYEVSESEIHIVAFLHGARDFGRWVSEEWPG